MCSTKRQKKWKQRKDECLKRSSALMEQREWVDKAADRVLTQPRFTTSESAGSALSICTTLGRISILLLVFISLLHLHLSPLQSSICRFRALIFIRTSYCYSSILIQTVQPQCPPSPHLSNLCLVNSPRQQKTSSEK